ncbi:hypothetical protein BV25DRAFT_1920759 [Artomyces pyxidatus]|uniref:Uncharacterized protein n=1 Tax=Artomyces pyxidatus TaxID=48021 RepID=A0ACB8SJW2_9AGAM|nr:hypothetical protein BV25DRAFT_1920759 [Artomyces pyxidatus]
MGVTPEQPAEQDLWTAVFHRRLSSSSECIHAFSPMAEALSAQTIDAEIDRIKDMLSATQAYRNFIKSPATRLPPEVLSKRYVSFG